MKPVLASMSSSAGRSAKRIVFGLSCSTPPTVATSCRRNSCACAGAANPPSTSQRAARGNDMTKAFKAALASLAPPAAKEAAPRWRLRLGLCAVVERPLPPGIARRRSLLLCPIVKRPLPPGIARRRSLLLPREAGENAAAVVEAGAAPLVIVILLAHDAAEIGFAARHEAMLGVGSLAAAVTPEILDKTTTAAAPDRIARMQIDRTRDQLAPRLRRRRAERGLGRI